MIEAAAAAEAVPEFDWKAPQYDPVFRLRAEPETVERLRAQFALTR